MRFNCLASGALGLVAIALGLCIAAPFVIVLLGPLLATVAASG
jgi:hypothetical protein